MLHYSTRFRRQWKRLSTKVKDEVDVRVDMLQKSEFDVSLNNHKLSGKYIEYRSINVTGDIRLAYKRVPDGFYLFTIGTHNELYK